MAEEGARPNAEVKDGLFTDLFGRDRAAGKNFISLYNALSGAALRPGMEGRGIRSHGR